MICQSAYYLNYVTGSKNIATNRIGEQNRKLKKKKKDILFVRNPESRYTFLSSTRMLTQQKHRHSPGVGVKNRKRFCFVFYREGFLGDPLTTDRIFCQLLIYL